MFSVRGAQRLVAWLLFISAAFAPTSVQAGGVLLYEVATPDIGYASAGYGSRADGPVTLLTNPAGMTRLDGIQVQVGTELLFGALTFAPDLNTSISGNNGGNAVGLFPNGSVFATFAPWKDVRLGIGLESNFGLSEKWDSGWVGRYYTTQSTLIGLSILPSVAWHIVGGLSVGATLNVMYGYLKQVVAVQNIEPNSADGALSVQSGAWGVGGNVGVLYEFTKGSRLGVTYTSPVSLGFGTTPQFSSLGPGLTAALKSSGLYSANINLGLTVPQTVMLSYFQQLTEKWAVMVDAGWQNWAAFGTVDVQVTAANPHSLTTDIGYTNTWHGALGGQVQLSEPWQLDFGVAYDSTMTTASNRSLSLAIGDAWRFGVGARWTVNDNWTLGLAYEFLWGGSPSVDVSRGLAGTVSGSYANTSIQFFTFNFTWKS